MWVTGDIPDLTFPYFVYTRRAVAPMRELVITVSLVSLERILYQLSKYVPIHRCMRSVATQSWATPNVQVTEFLSISIIRVIQLTYISSLHIIIYIKFLITNWHHCIPNRVHKHWYENLDTSRNCLKILWYAIMFYSWLSYGNDIIRYSPFSHVTDVTSPNPHTVASRKCPARGRIRQTNKKTIASSSAKVDYHRTFIATAKYGAKSTRLTVALSSGGSANEWIGADKSERVPLLSQFRRHGRDVIIYSNALYVQQSQTTFVVFFYRRQEC